MPPRLFGTLLVLVLALAIAAGLSLEITAQDAAAPHLLALGLSATAFAGALGLGLGVAVGAGRAPEETATAPQPDPLPESQPRADRHDDTAVDEPRVLEPDDNRAVIFLIWWPIELVCVGVAGLCLFLFASDSTIGEGTGLPSAIMLVLSTLGVFALPILIRSTARDFGGRGFRGFWRSFRRTEWGDGIPPVP